MFSLLAKQKQLVKIVELTKARRERSFDVYGVRVSDKEVLSNEAKKVVKLMTYLLKPRGEIQITVYKQ